MTRSFPFSKITIANSRLPLEHAICRGVLLYTSFAFTTLASLSIRASAIPLLPLEHAICRGVFSSSSLAFTFALLSIRTLAISIFSALLSFFLSSLTTCRGVILSSPIFTLACALIRAVTIFTSPQIDAINRGVRF